MHYHVRQLVGGQTHTLATSRWQPTAGQGRRQQHIQENTGNQWAFSLVVCSHSFGWYKPCLNGLQLRQTAGDGRRSFLRAKQTPEHGQPIRTALPTPPKKNPLRRCRYKRRYGRRWYEPRKNNKLRLHLASIKNRRAVQTEPKHGSSLCLEHAVTPGHAAIVVEVKTYFLFIFYVFIYLHTGFLLCGRSGQNGSLSSSKVGHGGKR